MQDAVKEKLFQKNQRLIDMVIERVKRDFPDDIVLIGLTGSFSTGDFHEKSDLDLRIVNETDRGWEISAGFILEDVGYDIYCTPWEPRIKAQSLLENPMAGGLIDLQVLYCANPETLDKFNAYRQKALDLLAKPIGEECIERAQRHLDKAKQSYADAMLKTGIGVVRYAAGGVLYECVNALTNLNNTYIKGGIKQYFSQVLSYQHVPENIKEMYLAVLRADSVEDLRKAAFAMLSAVQSLCDDMRSRFVTRPVPAYDNVWGIFEELWSNYANKVKMNTHSSDLSYAFHTALGAQSYVDEMTQMVGMPQYDLMARFDANDLSKFHDAFFRVVEDYKQVYKSVGRKIVQYDSIDLLYDDFMHGRLHR